MKGKLLINLLIIINLLIVLLFNLYPIIYKDHIMEYSNQYELDPYLVLAVIKVESNFDKDARSKKDAKGLMQISNQTGKWAFESLSLDNFTPTRLYDPKTNIRIGTWYLNKLIRQFDSIDLALASYNAGSGNVEGWLKDKAYSDDGTSLERIPFNETKEYVDKVNKSYTLYKKIYRKEYFLTENNILDKTIFKLRERATKYIRKLR